MQRNLTDSCCEEKNLSEKSQILLLLVLGWVFFCVLEQSFTYMKGILLFIPLAESWAHYPLHNLKANLFSFIVFVKDACGQFLVDLLYCSWDACPFEMIFFHPDCLVLVSCSFIPSDHFHKDFLWFSITVSRLHHWPEEAYGIAFSFSGKAQNLLSYLKGNSVYRQ